MIPMPLNSALDASGRHRGGDRRAGWLLRTTPCRPTPNFLAHLRAETTRRGVVLIFDEVVTGFRYAVGGAQEYFGVTPDMTTLAKGDGRGV